MSERKNLVVLRYANATTHIEKVGPDDPELAQVGFQIDLERKLWSFIPGRAGGGINDEERTEQAIGTKYTLFERTARQPKHPIGVFDITEPTDIIRMARAMADATK